MVTCVLRGSSSVVACVEEESIERVPWGWGWGPGFATSSTMWGPWAVGMASDPLAAKHLERIGLAVIPPELGLQALSLCLHLSHAISHPEVRTLSIAPSAQKAKPHSRMADITVCRKPRHLRLLL